MTEQPDESVGEDAGAPSRSPRVEFMRALGVFRNARIGIGAGLGLAVLVYVVFVLAPGETNQPPTLLVVLAVVVATSTSILVTTLLTVRNAARMTMSPPKWIRRGGLSALVGGASWAFLGLAPTVLDGGDLLPVTVGEALGYLVPLVPLAIVFGAWAVHAVNRVDGGYPSLPRELTASLSPANRRAASDAVGAVAFWTTTVGLLSVAWMAAIDLAVFLGGPTDIDPRIFVGGYCLALLGTSLLGAASLRADTLPREGSVALLFALPIALGGVTVLAYLEVTGLTAVPLGVVLGVAWVPIGRRLAAGTSIPDESRFQEALAQRAGGLPWTDTDADASDPDPETSLSGEDGTKR